MSFLTLVATFAVLDTCTAVDCVHTGRAHAWVQGTAARARGGLSGAAADPMSPETSKVFAAFGSQTVPGSAGTAPHYAALRPSPVVVCSSS